MAYINQPLFRALIDAGCDEELAEKAAETIVPVDVLREEIEGMRRQAALERWIVRSYLTIILFAIAAGVGGLYQLLERLS